MCCAVQLTVCWPGKWCWLCGRKQSTKKLQHVPTVVYIQYTSWWWATNMPETCRGWL